MRKDLVRIALGASLLAACTDDTSQTIETFAGDARIVRNEGGPLTPPSAAPAIEIVRHYLRPTHGAVVEQLQLAGAVPARGGLTHVRFEQRVGALRVYGSYVKAALTADGELVQVIEQLAPLRTIVAATIGSHDALTTVMARMGYSRRELFRDPTVERVLRFDGNALREAFLVETWSLRTNLLVHTLVDGTGEVVASELRSSTDRYNVYTEDPGKGAQTIVNGGTGWLGTGAQTTHNITGPNVHAYLDTDANNAPDTTTGGVAVTNGDFLTAANLAVSPSTTSNRAVAVQNLFYLNNVAHDVLFAHGFNVAAGNFQGNDPVNAEGQDGGGLDNANFATPADGSSPRMQMYLWSGTDGDAFVTVGTVNHSAFASTFGPKPTATGTAAPLALVNDGVGATSDGCEASPAGSLSGKVAIVDRGTCTFTVKVLNAQTAGAVAVVIANNAPGGAFAAGGTERKVKIPSVMVTQAIGATLRGQLGTQARVRTNPSPLRLDGDLDADIVFHEYGHGLTWRMIGGMSGLIAGAIGEGASDTNAFLINGDDVIGEYAFANPAGIRTQPYANYVGNYATSVTGTEVHNDGELYAAIMWRVMTNYVAAGLTVSDVQDDWVDGMNFTPSTPAYEHMRDGMLAGTADAARRCMIWEAFAHYGVGVGASGVVTGKNVTITNSFAKPTTCP